MARDTKMSADFSSKPKTAALADAIVSLVTSLGPTRRETRAQLTFGGKRKFIWMWTYGHTRDGLLFVTVCRDRGIRDPHLKYIKQVSPNRWNHHIEVQSAAQIESGWFKNLVKAGYDFSNR